MNIEQLAVWPDDRLFKRQAARALDGLLAGRGPSVSQGSWAVDSVGGNDAASGMSGAPLQSLTELGRRFAGKLIDPGISSITISLSGDFGEQALVLDLLAAHQVVVTVQGDVSTLHAGTIQTYTPFTPGTVRAALTDAVVADFSPYLWRRVRTAAGGVTWFTSASGASALLGQFYTYPYTATDPANGTSYTVDDLGTRIAGGVSVRVFGGARAVLKDLVFDVPTGKIAYYNLQAPYRTQLQFFGCLFAGIEGGTDDWHIMAGVAAFIACANAAGHFQWQGAFSTHGVCHQSSIVISVGGTLLSFGSVHDGNGTHKCRIILERGAYMEDLSHRGIFNQLNTSSSVLEILPGATYRSAAADASLWGTAGGIYGMVVRAGGKLLYTIKPTAPGSSQDAVVGGDVKSYAQIPYAHPVNGAIFAAYA